MDDAPHRVDGMYPHHTIEYWERDYPRVVETVRQDIPSLSNREIAHVLSMLTSICHHCWEQFGDCVCMRDD